MPRRILFRLSCLFFLGPIACSSTPEPAVGSGAQNRMPSPGEMNLQNFEIPTLTPLENGNIVVRFKKTGCSVLFDHDGKLLEGGRQCDDLDLYRARKAVKAHIAERAKEARVADSFKLRSAP